MPVSKDHVNSIVKKKSGPKEKWTPQILESLADDFIEWTHQKDSLWFEDFILQYHLPVSYLGYFAGKSEKFADALNYVRDWQKSKLIKGALFGITNPGFTKLLLSVYWKMRDTEALESKENQQVEIIIYDEKKQKIKAERVDDE